MLHRVTLAFFTFGNHNWKEHAHFLCAVESATARQIEVCICSETTPTGESCEMKVDGDEWK
jgi:hypothetical protein